MNCDFAATSATLKQKRVRCGNARINNKPICCIAYRGDQK